MNDFEELKDILVMHYKRYPLMQIQDMVKLIYQNEFAGGHYINDEAESLKRLKRELSEVVDVMDAEAVRSKQAVEMCGMGIGTGSGLFEAIGNGLCRLHLRGLKDGQLRPETVNRLFINTANANKGGMSNANKGGMSNANQGSMSNANQGGMSNANQGGMSNANQGGMLNANQGSMSCFEEKLRILRDCCVRKRLPYSVTDLDNYIQSCKKQGYPPVSHSESYREAYSPAYRIVKAVYRDYFEVFCRIDRLLNDLDAEILAHFTDSGRRCINVAIEGNSGAGKSSLAVLTKEIYDCNVFHMDDFFLTPDLRTEERLKEAGGNVDYVRFKKEVIEGIKGGNGFSYQIYDCSKGSLGQTVDVRPKRLNIIEGSYSMHPSLSDSYDLKIFLSLDKEEQSRRILERNGQSMHKRFITEWIPLENRYFSELGIAAQCDIVIEA